MISCTNNFFDAMRGRSRIRDMFRRNKAEKVAKSSGDASVAFQNVASSSSSSSSSSNSSKTAQQTVHMTEIPGPSQEQPTEMECILCCHHRSGDDIVGLILCNHFACQECLESYLVIEITESRIDIACPLCPQAIHPTDIQKILAARPEMFDKYESFMVRRVLLMDPDSRWCPAPDCSYAVIAAGCASCPRLTCGQCLTEFCYHCKEKWHPDQTCDAARVSRRRQCPPEVSVNYSSAQSSGDDARTGSSDIKPCPRCQVLIIKMDDGSCNHMVCAVCGSEFCWLCMKVITDLHFLSPSGCTFWGKKPWSRKKKILWQMGTLVGAPVGIGLLAGIAIPAIVVGIPVWTGRKIFTRYKAKKRFVRNFYVTGGILASVAFSPIVAVLAVTVGVPILLFYVYGVIPLSLFRASCTNDDDKDPQPNHFNSSEGDV